MTDTSSVIFNHFRRMEELKERIDALMNERSGMIETHRDQLQVFTKQIQQYEEQQKLAERTIKTLQRKNTDLAYLNQAYYRMLGPKGRTVANGWHKQGITRIHFSWNDDVTPVVGEEAAQFILDFEQAVKSAVLTDTSDL